MARLRITLSLFALAILPVLASTAEGCSCGMDIEGTHPCRLYSDASAVFVGQVTEIGPNTPIKQEGGQTVYTTKGVVIRFSLEEAFRGVEGKSVETYLTGTSCDYNFKQGERYFVYATRDASTQKLHVGSCSGTRPLDDASADLSYARALMRGDTGPGLFGAVVRQVRQTETDYVRTVGIAGIRVIVEGEGRQMNLLTDGEGRFYVAGLPLGKYRARAEIPGNLRITYQTEKDVEISEGRCSGVIFIATSLSRISGRLVDAQGKPVEGVKIDLVPVDSSNKEISNEQDFESHTDKEGRYSFGTLAAGRYSVAINHKGQPITHDQIYRTTFYPNTTDLSQARILALAEGQELTVDDFSLPPRIVEASIEGVVLWADGSPVRRAGVDLELIDHQTTEQIAMTDDEGRFSIKGIEGFRYRVHASIIQNRRPMHAEPVEVLMGQRGKPITLVINIIGRDPVYLRKQSSAPQK